MHNCIIISLEKTDILLFCCPFLKLLPWNKCKRYSSVAKYVLSVQVFWEGHKGQLAGQNSKRSQFLGILQESKPHSSCKMFSSRTKRINIAVLQHTSRLLLCIPFLCNIFALFSFVQSGIISAFHIFQDKIAFETNALSLFQVQNYFGLVQNILEMVKETKKRSLNSK